MIQQEIGKEQTEVSQDEETNADKENEVKSSIKSEIAKLSENVHSQGIEAYQEVVEYDKKHKNSHQSTRAHNEGYHSSVHHAAAEVTIQHFKYVI